MNNKKVQIKRKAAFHNLGCKVNAYETDAMEEQLRAHGYEIVPFAEGADVYVINTCTVTNIADRKSRQMLHRARKMNPYAVVVAAGCYVQAAGDVLREDPDIDLVIGNNQKGRLWELLEAYEKGQEKAEAVIDIDGTREYEPLRIHGQMEHTRAFIKVQDGCNQFCSYCIIPYARGRVRSRRPEDVAAEVEELAQKGCQEVVLTGIHLSSYGVDFSETEEEKGDFPLLALIRRLHGIPQIRRIRLGSLEPRIVTEEFVGSLSQLEKFCPHFHLSLQSGCDETLKRMNRRYTTEEYLEGCERIRRHFDHPAITTDVIVGFPGEDQEEFLTTVHFLETVRFFEMHIFKYSKRKKTRAARMEGQVAETVKAERSRILLSLEDTMSKEFRAYYIGKKVEILLEEEIKIGEEAYMVGHTREYVKCAVKGGRPNEFVTGQVSGFLTGQILLAETTC